MGLDPFHIGLSQFDGAFCEIPQSKIKDFCQLPFTRELFCARYRRLAAEPITYSLFPIP